MAKLKSIIGCEITTNEIRAVEVAKENWSNSNNPPLVSSIKTTTIKMGRLLNGYFWLGKSIERVAYLLSIQEMPLLYK